MTTPPPAHRSHDGSGQAGGKTGGQGWKPRILITAGPTHEPIDSVRFIGNRSSGKLGVLLADETARKGWPTVLLLGPTALWPTEPSVATEHFRTTADLAQLLALHQPACDVLVMAAAVADFRPMASQQDLSGKLRRTNHMLTLHLEPTEDLLAGCSQRRLPGQLLIGFALEPRETMLQSARDKLARKKVDAIVANPLETMESDSIEATLVVADGRNLTPPGKLTKAEFAAWLVSTLEEVRHAPQTS